MVGFSGLASTVAAIKAGKTIALANKETLVAAGQTVMEMTLEHKARILPVDSEHSAIFQCLMGCAGADIEKIHLTASGGPFRTWTKEQISRATAQQALRHPKWDMGAKISIDSATMMNKCLEIIEARWLFGTPADKINVVIHHPFHGGICRRSRDCTNGASRHEGAYSICALLSRKKMSVKQETQFRTTGQSVLLCA